jgi:hypothetical protein
VTEIVAHRANDEATLRRHLAAEPDAVELDVVLGPDGLVVAHELDLSDFAGLTLDDVLPIAGDTAAPLTATAAGRVIRRIPAASS